MKKFLALAFVAAISVLVRYRRIKNTLNSSFHPLQSLSISVQIIITIESNSAAIDSVRQRPSFTANNPSVGQYISYLSQTV
jgi:hypothetical protein